ncbi:hypothetical protein [Streptomyces sp. NPDC059611]|uniref:hypothetical protein n=1 Tax=Streptomyces sp. NPDC059611 TaxID=3346884 RepID=UPI0036C9B239
MRTHWHRAIADLSAQGAAARAAAQRVDDAPGSVRPTAKAISKAVDADYLRSASELLRAHLTDRRPPRRLPVARVWPWFRDVWEARAGGRRGGVWRAVPRDADLVRMRSAPSSDVLAAAVEQAEALQASLHGKRTMGRLYESYIPGPRSDAITELVGGGRPAPTLPGFPDPGHIVNRCFPRGSGRRIRPDRREEFNRLSVDRSAVHTRARAFGDAVLALLVEDRMGGDAPQPGRLRGAGRWVGHERHLVPDRTKWPAKLNAYRVVTLAGLAWLVLACSALPLTFGMKAGLLSNAPLLLVAAILIACAGIALVVRHGPKLIKAPGLGAAVPGIAAGFAALMLWQGQGSVSSYYFAGPYERYEREYADECLAASPYRHESVRSMVDGGVLTVTPLSGGTTLRLGPAEDGSTHPLRPQDRATRAVLDEYGC